MSFPVALADGLELRAEIVIKDAGIWLWLGVNEETRDVLAIENAIRRQFSTG